MPSFPFSASMDAVFLLNPEAQLVFMKTVLEPLGWNYILLWELEPYSSKLPCKNGWYKTCNTDFPGIRQGYFDMYKLCSFSVDSGVLGLAYGHPPFIWLNEEQLLSLSSSERQKEFYMEGGIKTAVFIACRKGVIELGTMQLLQATGNSISFIMSILGSVISSLTSGTSSNISKSPSSSYSLIESPDITPIETLPLVPLLDLSPGPIDYELVAEPNVDQRIDLDIGLYASVAVEQQQHQQHANIVDSGNIYIHESAFSRPGESSIPVARVRVTGQLSFKRCIAMLKRIQAEQKAERQRVPSIVENNIGKPPGVMSNSQVHHMISERRRREKLKESFEALRSFFPHSSRKDKASILTNTKNYLTSLKTKIEELELKNDQLQLELMNVHQARVSELLLQELPDRSTTLKIDGSLPKVDVFVSHTNKEEMMVHVTLPNKSSSGVDTIKEVLECIEDMRFCVISTSAYMDKTEGPFRLIITVTLPNEGETEELLNRLKDGLSNLLIQGRE